MSKIYLNQEHSVIVSSLLNCFQPVYISSFNNTIVGKKYCFLVFH